MPEPTADRSKVETRSHSQVPTLSAELDGEPSLPRKLGKRQRSPSPGSAINDNSEVKLGNQNKLAKTLTGERPKQNSKEEDDTTMRSKSTVSNRSHLDNLDMLKKKSETKRENSPENVSDDEIEAVPEPTKDKKAKKDKKKKEKSEDVLP